MTDEERKKNLSFRKRLEKACRGLVYINETDVLVDLLFGKKAKDTSETTMLEAVGLNNEQMIDEVSFEIFFQKLTAKKEWHDTRQVKNAEKFELRDILATELSDLKVFRVGNINIDIYILGIDQAGNIV